MNSTRRWMVAALVAGGLTLGIRSEAADGTVSFDLASAYVYHGITYNDGPVFQPSMDVSNGRIGFNTWANMDIGDYGDSLQSGEFSEVDLTVYYLATAIGVNWCLSYAEYLFPHVTDTNGVALAGTREIILSGERPLPLGFVAGVKVQYDIDEGDDFYARLSLGYNRAIGEAVDVSVTATGAYAGDGITATGKSGLHDYGFKLGLVYKALKNLKLNGSVGYADSWDEEVLPEQDVHVYGSIGLSYAM